jgi:hypothetical protein
MPAQTPASDHTPETASPELPTGSPRFLLAALFVWALAFFGTETVVPFVPGVPRQIGMFVSAALVVALSFCSVIGWSKLRLHRSVYLLLGALAVVFVIKGATPMITRVQGFDLTGRGAGALVFVTAALADPTLAGSAAVIQTRNDVYQELQTFLGETFPETGLPILLLNLAQLLLASGIGLWIGCGIDKPGHLLPIAMVAGLADIWSVSAGATAVIIRSTTIYYFLLRFPLVMGPQGSYPFLIGLTDFLFFGIFYQAAFRFQLGLGKNIAVLAAAFLLAVTAALFFGVGLPVLPFMAVFFVLVNWQTLKLEAEEIRQVVLFCLVAGTVAMICTTLMR